MFGKKNRNMRNEDLLLEYIDEVAHKLNNQSNIGDKITDAIYADLLKVNKAVFKTVVNVSEFNTYVDEVTINVFIDGNLRDSYAQINDFSPIIIELHVSKYWDLIPEVELKNGIKKSIVHELMHGNIFTKKYNKIKGYDRETIIKSLNDYPQYFPDINRIISFVNPDSLIYRFSYALYTSYYHETQAFIAQSDVYFKDIFINNKNRKLDNEKLRGILKNCQEYQIFVQNIEVVNTIRRMSYTETKVFITEFNSLLSQQNSMDDVTLYGLLKKIEQVAHGALKSIEDIIMSDYYEIFS